ncbi:hypothetical protein AALO_G00043550 [Alosa alosa]|uniref:Uncharacterized protein n=1 Tax=Alosa alosa TaxID=278164 RepID=A0AAV6H8P1_9TELE|nr:hypothetical protein AALO_G00043550 [Alosa alosa]
MPCLEEACALTSTRGADIITEVNGEIIGRRCELPGGSDTSPCMPLAMTRLIVRLGRQGAEMWPALLSSFSAHLNEG